MKNIRNIASCSTLLVVLLTSSLAHGGQFLRLNEPRSQGKTTTQNLQGKTVAEDGVPVPLDLPKLTEEAESGRVESQTLLAKLLDRGTHGVVTNKVEAYKWAVIATSQGHRPAKHLLGAYDLFMTEPQKAEGRTLAAAYLARQKKD